MLAMLQKSSYYNN